ncbi:MAG: superoxide dismutase [Candidatus Competibacteraceae bacterium]|nr:superoxide dismutase [Candidatus Competibacteraceae bacterium]
MAFELPSLPYAFDALEPYIDALTMEIHHDRHHAAYTNNLNAAIKDSLTEKLSIESIMAEISKHPAAIRNNGGGYFNHNLFWTVMKKQSESNPSGELLKAIERSFGTVDAFKEEFNKAAISRFGSGWAWLVYHDGGLVVTSTPNQDNPLMDIAEVKGFPILGLDVWEHAYYLKYQNKRPDYVQNFWHVINWDQVADYFNQAKKQ